MTRALNATSLGNHDIQLLDIRNFGALCNGQADDTVAVQNAINAVSSIADLSAGGIYIPSGSTKITGTITVPLGNSIGGGCIVGNGRSSVITMGNNANVSAITVPAGADYWRFESFALQGNSSNNSAGHGILCAGSRLWLNKVYIDNFKEDGVKFTGADSHKLTDCHIRGNQQNGVETVAPATDVEMIGCLVGTNQLAGVKVGTGSFHLTNTHIFSSGTDGILVSSGIAEVSAVNCDIENNFGAGINWVGSNTGCSVVGCILRRNALEGLKGASSTNCIISGNIIRENSAPAGTLPGITLSGTSLDVVINGNNFYDNQSTKTQTHAVVSSGSSDRLVITGNTMRAAQHKTGSSSLVGASNISGATLNTV